MKKRILSLFLSLLLLFLFASCTKDEIPLPSHNTSESPSTNTGVSTSDTSKSDDTTSPLESTTPSENTEDTTPPPIPEPQTIRFLCAGDNIIHECVYLDAMARAEAAASAGEMYQSYFFDDMYSEVASLVKSADIAFVNQEGPITGNDQAVSGYPYFNAPTAAGNLLLDLGFDIVNIANNHMLDRDDRLRQDGTRYQIGTGYQDTLTYWGKQDIFMIGGYENQTDYDTIRIYQTGELRIAMLSYTYGTNGLILSTKTPDLVVPYIDDSTIQRHIASAKTQADLVFVSMHWGTENTFTPDAEQKRLAKLISECGADVIIGHHSHTIQPIEWLESANGNKTLVIYSLGNLISTMLQGKNMIGGIVTFDIVIEEGKDPYIASPIMIPIMCHYENDYTRYDSLDLYVREKVKLFLLEDYTNTLAKNHGANYYADLPGYNYASFDLKTLFSYVTNTISEEYLPASFLNRANNL